MDGEEDVWLECHCVCERWWRNGTIEIPHEPISGYKVGFSFFQKKKKKEKGPEPYARDGNSGLFYCGKTKISLVT